MMNSVPDEAGVAHRAEERPFLKRRKVASPIEAANKMSNEEFLKTYIRPR